jgi:hypothetical protein
LNRLLSLSPFRRTAVTALVLAAVVSRPAPAASALHREVGAFAEKIQDVLRDKGHKSVAVGEFTGPAGMDSNAGPGIQQLLATQLRRLGVSVPKVADASVKGEYLAVADPADKGRTVLRLRAVLRNRADAVLGRFQADLRGEEDVARALGLTGQLPLESEARKRQLPELIDHPSVYLSGTRAQTRRDSRYSVEIRVRDGVDQAARALKPAVHDGQAFVQVKRGQLYEIHVRNRSGRDAAVTITIDGLDVFTFSEERDDKTGQPKYRNYLLRKGGEMTVVGWHKTNTRSDSFQVTALANSAVGKLMADTANVGVITVGFHDSVPVPVVKPKVARVEKRAMARRVDGSGGKDADATGFGPSRKTSLRLTKRRSGPLREVVSLRYTRP